MIRQHEEFLRCDWSAEDITQMAKDLARSNNTRASLEQQKKQVDSQLKSQIEEQNTIIGRLSQSIAAGCEWRNVECRVELDTPEVGRKRIIRLDTGEEVRVVLMTDQDKQMALDLQEKAEAEADEKAQQEQVIVTPPPLLQRIEAPTPTVAPDEITNGVTVLPMDSPGEEQGHGKRGKRK